MAQHTFVSIIPVGELAQERPLAPPVYLSEQRVVFLPCPRKDIGQEDGLLPRMPRVGAWVAQLVKHLIMVPGSWD